MAEENKERRYTQPGRPGFLPGNPGKPRGAITRDTTIPNGTTRTRRLKIVRRGKWAENLIELTEETFPVIKKAIKKGDMSAVRMVLDRSIPVTTAQTEALEEQIEELRAQVEEMRKEHAQALNELAGIGNKTA